MKEEEVVELVRPEPCLRIVGRGAGKEFRRDRRGGNLAQEVAKRLFRFACDQAQGGEDHCLRHGGVDLVHAHVVAVVGIPPEGDL